ncbi:unnamed protein product [Prorocentrum cordatum]|uniref:Uncharacterized protein n=1 Tax=Prorocentrum cordatum TaxID=2364126 RepID=A0ABN9PPB5_9DINO|nr:unnamed protein product [Polarella glacialis]
MGLLARWSQEDERAPGGQDIRSGTRVVVLGGRHFDAFEAGDAGLVTRVDLEAQNCEVLFEGRASAVPVALRHLRAAPSSLEAASAGPASPLGRAEASPTARPRGGAAHWPRGYADSAEAFAAGLAAVGAGQGEAEAALGGPRSPAALLDAASSSSTAPAPMRRRACSDAGLRVARVAEEEAAATPPARAAAPPSSPPRPAQVGQASSPATPAGSPVAGGWRANRLEALEARLARVEEEHRSEVASLRQALEQCVQSIGACALALDLGSADAPGSQACVAAALRDAAGLGQRALESCRGARPCSGTSGCSPEPRARHVPVEVLGCSGPPAGGTPGPGWRACSPCAVRPPLGHGDAAGCCGGGWPSSPTSRARQPRLVAWQPHPGGGAAAHGAAAPRRAGLQRASSCGHLTAPQQLSPPANILGSMTGISLAALGTPAPQPAKGAPAVASAGCVMVVAGSPGRSPAAAGFSDVPFSPVR